MGRTKAQTQTRNGKAIGALVALCAVAFAGASLFLGLNTAAGADGADTSTLGLGSQLQTLDVENYVFDPAEKLGVADGSADAVEGLAQATQRATSGESSAVVELAAVDLGDPATMRAAAKIGVLNPPSGVKTRSLDTSGEGWLTGIASGYDVESSSTLTRSGRAFDDDCVTVAVPEGQEDLLGHPVIIVYEDKVVVATVTDTGGFAKYGRVLDLGGGVFKAFGHEDIWDWGIREVHYKFL